MRIKKRQEYLEDSLLDGEDIKRLKKATEALKKGDVISLEEIKKDLEKLEHKIAKRIDKRSRAYRDL